jgi:hypothetical protein
MDNRDTARAVVSMDDVKTLRAKYENKSIVPNKITIEEIMFQEGAKRVLDDLEKYIRENDMLGGVYGR